MSGRYTELMARISNLRALRAEQPQAIEEALRTRERRGLLHPDGRLFIVAADHPARGALVIGRNSSAMADRVDLLERLSIALAHPGVDGVLGTPDIIEDLAALGLLDNKVIVGSMNRGGLRGATFEMDDRITAFDIPTMVDHGIDFAKALLRINLADPGTVSTLETAATAVTAAAAARLPIMLEPFVSTWENGRIVNDLSTDAVILSIAIASGLGASSAYTWLKLPVVDEMERVLDATTMPVLLLGGDSGADLEVSFAAWESALGLPGVRGLTIGRALLYPADGNVADAVDTAANLVHPSIRSHAKEAT